jgi:hypothetical protein
MVAESLADADVLIKGACYDVLRKIADHLALESSITILGASRYTVPHHLERDSRISNHAAAIARWEDFLRSAREIEPTSEELALATEIEEAAAAGHLSVDVGESQLAAIAILRGSADLLLTGDKRAIRSLERLLEAISGLSRLAHRVGCLEQIIASLLNTTGVEEMAEGICSEAEVDVALATCFSCHSGAPCTLDSALEGLTSYIENLRADAPGILCPGTALR